MSYHIGPRVLARQAGACGPIGFVEVLGYLLSAHVAPSHLHALGQQLRGQPPGHAALTQSLQEHLSVDLGPIGLAARQLFSSQSLADIWNRYHQMGQVLAPSAMHFGPEGVRLAFHQSGRVETVVEHVAQALGETFQSAVARNRHRRVSAWRQGRPYRPEVGLSRVSELAKVFGMPALVVDACLFFESDPKAQVSNWIRSSGFPVWRLERWFGELDITQQSLCQACALVGASQSLLGGRDTLREVAERHGFTDAAHLTRVFKRASGGLPPGLFSGILLDQDFGLMPGVEGRTGGSDPA